MRNGSKTSRQLGPNRPRAGRNVEGRQSEHEGCGPGAPVNSRLEDLSAVAVHQLDHPRSSQEDLVAKGERDRQQKNAEEERETDLARSPCPEQKQHIQRPVWAMTTANWAGPVQAETGTPRPTLWVLCVKGLRAVSTATGEAQSRSRSVVCVTVPVRLCHLSPPRIDSGSTVFPGYGDDTASAMTTENGGPTRGGQAMPKHPRDKGKQRRWMTFLRNHKGGIAALDCFVVPTTAFRLL